MDSCPWHLQRDGKASRCGSLIRLTAILIVTGQCATACQLEDAGNRRIHAGFAFERLAPASVGVVSDRLSAPLTPDDQHRALSARAYAPAGADRTTILHAIGRGIGRTAVHEFAHQILGPAAMDGTHFFAQLHWGPAAVRLRQRIGLRPHR